MNSIEPHDDTNALVKYFNYKREPSSGARCIDLGRVSVKPHGSYPPYPEKLPYVYQEVTVGRQLDELHLVYIDSGYGWYKNDLGENFRIVPGTAILLYPNVYHAYAPDDEQGWSEFWVGCTGSYPDWLMAENAFPRKNSVMRLGRMTGLADDFGQLCRTALSGHPPAIKSQLLGGVINRILGRLVVLHGAPQSRMEAAENDTVERIIAHLEANVETDADMGSLAELAGMRYDRLTRLFQGVTGMTPHQYYLDRKIKTAMRYLRSGLSVKETSYRLCFDSPYYFSRLFKKKTGESPRNYKVKNSC